MFSTYIRPGEHDFWSFQQVVTVNYNDGIMKPLVENDRNGLEYYSPVNFESIDIHFGIVLLEYHLDGIPWTHMIT